MIYLNQHQKVTGIMAAIFNDYFAMYTLQRLHPTTWLQHSLGCLGIMSDILKNPHFLADSLECFIQPKPRDPLFETNCRLTLSPEMRKRRLIKTFEMKFQ